MANIRLTLPGEPFTGQIVTFTAPCDCDRVTDGLFIGGQVYTIVDANGQCATGKGGRWTSGASVSVILNVEKKLAYIQNADTNEYLEGRFETLATALNGRIDDLLSQIGGGSDVEVGYYDGVGGKQTINFNFNPKFVYISSAAGQHSSFPQSWGWVKGTNYLSNNSGGSANPVITEGEKTISISWVNDAPITSGKRYDYVAIG